MQCFSIHACSFPFILKTNIHPVESCSVLFCCAVFCSLPTQPPTSPPRKHHIIFSRALASLPPYCRPAVCSSKDIMLLPIIKLLIIKTSIKLSLFWQSNKLICCPTGAYELWNGRGDRVSGWGAEGGGGGQGTGQLCRCSSRWSLFSCVVWSTEGQNLIMKVQELPWSFIISELQLWRCSGGMSIKHIRV